MVFLRFLRLVLFLATAGSFCFSPAQADPLHQLAGGPVWRHEFSGWLFPPAIGELQLDGPPYQLDGNDSVGARYLGAGTLGNGEIGSGQDGAGTTLQLELKILVGDMPVPTAEGTPFQLAARPELQGVRRETTDPATTTVRYQFTLEKWTVIVEGQVATQANAGALLDAALGKLPWDSLGSSERLH